MAQTNFAALTSEELTVWRKDVWRQARETSFIMQSGLMGSDENSMIQRITELKASEKGARAVITLVADLEGDGIAGDRTLEGNEEAMKSYEQVIRIDQLRHANRHEGRLAEQKSVVSFRENSKNVLAHWYADRWDQLAFLTMSGVSYANTTAGVARVGSDFPNLEFNTDVTAPSTNRHRRWKASDSTIEAGNTANVVATDYPTWKMLVIAKAYAKNNFIRPVRGTNGQELYHVFMTPNQFARLKQDNDFLLSWRHAMPRSADNPIFKGLTTGIMVDGLMLHEYRHVYHATNWGGGAVAGARILFCGAQALGFADIGDPYWVEKEFDYNNQPGISVGKMGGMKKPVFRSHVTGTNEDFGVLAIDASNS